MKLSSQSDEITLQLKTASVSCFASTTPSSPATFSISAMMPEGPATLPYFIIWSALPITVKDTASSQRGLRELTAWPLKLDIEQPSIVLNPCLYLVFICYRKITSIIVYHLLWFNHDAQDGDSCFPLQLFRGHRRELNCQPINQPTHQPRQPVTWHTTFFHFRACSKMFCVDHMVEYSNRVSIHDIILHMK